MIGIDVAGLVLGIAPILEQVAKVAEVVKPLISLEQKAKDWGHIVQLLQVAEATEVAKALISLEKKAKDQEDMVRLHQRNRLRARRPHGSSPTVPGIIHGTRVAPLADSGASHNYVSEDYARLNGFNIESTSRGTVKLADSRLAIISGTTTLPFKFANDAKVYNIQFKVLRQCVHDMILGGPFLRLTETFTRFADRIKWNVGNRFARTCSFIDDGATQQYISGWCDGNPVAALPDTGSQILLLSEGFAKSSGYKIRRGPRNRIALRLGDGSIVQTEGLVRNVGWRYDEGGRMFRENFFVLKDLPCDVVLSCDFLCGTQALEEYSHLLFDSDLSSLPTLANLNVIVNESHGMRWKAKTSVKSVFGRQSSNAKDSGGKPLTTTVKPLTFEQKKTSLLRRAEEIDRLPPDKQAAARQALDAEWNGIMKKPPELSDPRRDANQDPMR